MTKWGVCNGGTQRYSGRTGIIKYGYGSNEDQVGVLSCYKLIRGETMLEGEVPGDS